MAFTLATDQCLELRFLTDPQQVLIGFRPTAGLRFALDCLSGELDRTVLVAVQRVPASRAVLQARAVRPPLQPPLEQALRALRIRVLQGQRAEGPLPR